MKIFRIVYVLLAAAVFQSYGLYAQRPIAPEELASWKRVRQSALSDDGKWAAAVIAPWDGDASVHIYNAKGKEAAHYFPADRLDFSSSSQYAVVRLVPARELTDSLKAARTKKDKMPMNRLAIRRLAGGEEIIDSVETYKLAEGTDWIAYRRTQKDKTLILRSLDGSVSRSFPDVSEFGFAAEGSMLYYLTKGDTLGTAAGLYTLKPEDGTPRLVKEGKEAFGDIVWSRDGSRLAFLYAPHQDSAYNATALWLYDGSAVVEAARRGHAALPGGWVVSEHAKPEFSADGRRLFFGTSPEPRRRDTAQLAERRPDVHIWSWNEPVQYTVQNYRLKEEQKRSYAAVYDVVTGTVVQLADRELPEMHRDREGELPAALLTATEPYSLSSMWEGTTRRDVYAVSYETGERRPLLLATFENPRLSPGGKYAFGYSRRDSAWYTIGMADGRMRKLTSPETFPAWDEDFDMPDYPSPHGIAGWTEGDGALLVYDRYDIWKLDPEGQAQPVNMTVDGRRKGIQYRYLRLDREERFIDSSRPKLLHGFDTATKGSGYYEAVFDSPAVPKTLVAGNFMMRTPVKAKNADAVLYTKETFSQFPELLLSDMRFKKAQQLTRLGRQQEGIRWGTAELVTWTSLDGKRIEGTLHKPAGFDPSKKYPLIVNFYERSSEGLHNYHMPQPHRSTVDYHMYNSNGYVIFNPDVVYDDGFPGQSAFNCVMPGIAALIEQGFVDEKAIGAQGHSWGAYQVAYLATRTTLFAAIEAGAPVVNMFSAYGGIRWGSGMARAFQYEHTQSRIGGTPWGAQQLFIENSPLFTMDKVTAPILIMHNDNDGHVPWYQGIEYFVALKRLGKPAWLLNYPGEIHWPDKMANRTDFQKRMLQFFDYYLKGAPMPVWMKDGVRAVDRDFELGYDLTADCESQGL